MDNPVLVKNGGQSYKKFMLVNYDSGLVLLVN